MEHYALAKNIDEAVKVALSRFRVVTEGEFTYGWHQKSAGCRVTTLDGEILWLRIQSRVAGTKPSFAWFGLKDAESVAVNNKPQLKSVIEWENDSRVWRAELMTFIPYQVCSQTPELRASLELETTWYKTLRTSLDNLSIHKTDRVNTRQDLITRRLQERFESQINPNVEIWTTAHGDIHWANLTFPECWILDWEAWGQGPLGLDAATLYCFSLMQPDVAAYIYVHFKDLLDTPDGIRSQLFTCAELMRMAELYGDHPDLYPYLEKLTDSLLTKRPQLH